MLPLLGSFPESFASAMAAQPRLDLQSFATHIATGLIEIGLPLCRVGLHLETLHPIESGVQAIWEDGEMIVTHRERAGVVDGPYLASPMRIVDTTEQPLRVSLLQGDGGFPALAPMRDRGATDYYLYPFPFIDTTRTAAMSFVTRAEGGFSDADLERLGRAAMVVSPFAERAALRQIALNLLGTYVGVRTGQRVFGGQIDRGAVDEIEAAMLFGDLRSFTALSNRAAPKAVIALLDAWFDLVGSAVEAEEGEILKFIGDGVLAIFGARGNPKAAAERALRASRLILAKAADIAVQIGEEVVPVEFGLGVHLGKVSYGNVGTRTRLDFTVIGPAVNLASRIQDLTKSVGTPAVATGAIAELLEERLEDLGRFPVRGFTEPVALYRI